MILICVVNRAGFHTEHIDAKLFLERWIPFDSLVQSIYEENQLNKPKDLANYCSFKTFEC